MNNVPRVLLRRARGTFVTLSEANVTPTPRDATVGTLFMYLNRLRLGIRAPRIP